jgi:outer membrane protein
MKKKIIAPFFAVAALMLVVSQVSFAQDMEGRLGIGARVAYTNYSDDFGSVLDTDGEATMYGGNLTYFVQRYLSLELSVDYVETDLDLKVTGTSVDIGDLEQIPILLSLRAHLSTNPKVSPYFIIGAGYYLNDFDMKSSIPTGYYLDPDDSFGWHLGGGIEYFFNEHFAFNFDLKYLWSNVDIDITVPGVYSVRNKNFDVDAFISGVGFKFYF